MGWFAGIESGKGEKGGQGGGQTRQNRRGWRQPGLPRMKEEEKKEKLKKEEERKKNKRRQRHEALIYLISVRCIRFGVRLTNLRVKKRVGWVQDKALREWPSLANPPSG